MCKNVVGNIGDRTFRIPAGYDSIAIHLLRSTRNHETIVRLNLIIQRIAWKQGVVNVEFKSTLDGTASRLRCRKAIITVSLGVLQAGAIEFDPEPSVRFTAARSLKFGHVYRVAFRFPAVFWEESERFENIGFLISRDKRFSTWWTTHPLISPVLTAWMAASAAEQFRSSTRAYIVKEALGSLARIMHRGIPPPAAAYFHDLRRDPYFRGAYSYVPVNQLTARASLAKPVQSTLYFAGEAAETNGHASTVHGAIASGLRAAELVQGKR
jgi:monoamine oxidase